MKTSPPMTIHLHLLKGNTLIPWLWCLFKAGPAGVTCHPVFLKAEVKPQSSEAPEHLRLVEESTHFHGLLTALLKTHQFVGGTAPDSYAVVDSYSHQSGLGKSFRSAEARKKLKPGDHCSWMWDFFGLRKEDSLHSTDLANSFLWTSAEPGKKNFVLGGRLRGASLVVVEHEKVPTEEDLQSYFKSGDVNHIQSSTITAPGKYPDVVDRLPRAMQFPVWVHDDHKPDETTRFPEKFTGPLAEHNHLSLTIRTASPRYYAVANLCSGGGVMSFWPWLTVETPENPGNWVEDDKTKERNKSRFKLELPADLPKDLGTLRFKTAGGECLLILSKSEPFVLSDLAGLFRTLGKDIRIQRALAVWGKKGAKPVIGCLPTIEKVPPFLFLMASGDKAFADAQKYNEASRFDEALHSLEQAAEFFRLAFRDEPKTQEARGSLEKALIFLVENLGRVANKKDFLQTAEFVVATFRELRRPKNRSDVAHLADALSALADCHTQLGQHEDASELLKEACALSRSLDERPGEGGRLASIKSEAKVTNADEALRNVLHELVSAHPAAARDGALGAFLAFGVEGARANS
jgi:tetratricopeptide (TPR) repeat protein